MNPVVSNSTQLPENIFFTKLLNVFSLTHFLGQREESELAKTKAAPITVAKGRNLDFQGTTSEKAEWRSSDIYPRTS